MKAVIAFDSWQQTDNLANNDNLVGTISALRNKTWEVWPDKVID